MSSNNQRNKNSGTFGPILLIAFGFFWLLSNFGILPDLNWATLLNLWPLLLIFLGLNIIVSNAPGVLGKLLSTLVSFAAIGTMVILLLFSDSVPMLNTLDRSTVTVEQPVQVALEAAEEAQIRIDMGAASTVLYALEGSDQLLDGIISYYGTLALEASGSTDRRTVDLNTVDNGWHIGGQRDALHPWEIGLNGSIPLDLRLDSGSGALDLQLAGLELSNFDVDASSGRVNAVLPAGGYDVKLDLSSGASSWILPASGSGEYEIDGGSGRIELLLPQSMAARIEVDGGSGSFSADSRFTKLSSNDEDSTWETANYESAEDRIEIKIDQGAGSVSIELPSGR